MIVRRLVPLIVLVLLGGCTEEQAKEAAKTAIDKGKVAASVIKEEGGELAGKAAEKGGELAHVAAEKGGELAHKAADKGSELAGQAAELGKEGVAYAQDQAVVGATSVKAQSLELGGALSRSTMAWLRERKPEAPTSMAAVIAKGSQIKDVAVEIHATVDEAIDSDTEFEPIYQQVDDPIEADSAINKMGRVEVIDGLQVGFEDMTGWEGTERRSKSGYLVMWRHGDHLVGFVYRSEKDIDMSQIISDAPRLIGLITGVF